MLLATFRQSPPVGLPPRFHRRPLSDVQRSITTRRRGIHYVAHASDSEFVPEAHVEPSTAFYASPYDKEILQVALPALCAGLLGPVSTAVDTGTVFHTSAPLMECVAVVGQLGTLQLSGLAVGAVVYMFLSNLFVFIQFLITPAVARIIVQAILLSGLCGCVCGLTVFVLTGPIVQLLNPPMAVRGFAETYLKVMATSIPPFILYQGLAGILRGLKDTITIFRSSGVATVVNIVLDVIFVFGFHWGVFGAALATALCTYISTGMMLHRVLTSGKVKRQHFLAPAVSSTSQKTSKLLGDGIALIIRTMTLLGLIVFSSMLMSKEGPIVHSAYEICRIVFLLAHVTYTAFDYTMQSICAFYLGKNDRFTARAVLMRSLQMVFGLTALLSAALFLFSSPFARLFTASVEVLEEYHKVALALLLPIPLGGIAAVLDGSLLGASRFKLVAISQFLVAMIASTLLFSFRHHQILSLPWTAVFVRIGLSAHILFTSWIALGMEYSLPKQM